MGNAINWKVFFVLLAASVAASFSVLPFVVAILPAVSEVFTPALLVAQLIQTLVIFSISIFVGMYLAKRVGFGLPVLEAALEGNRLNRPPRIKLALSIGLGILAALMIVLLSLPFWDISVTLLRAEMSIPMWKGFLASFYGGIAEEILCRLFLMTLLVWISSKIKKTHDGGPTKTGIWVAIVLSSIVFGLGHVPITSEIIALSPAVAGRAVLLNVVAGIIFGWLYQKYGLESAMVSHFSCDIVLHVAAPLIASAFVY
jgi:membrane protease YdiL (CAAX protease family)